METRRGQNISLQQCWLLRTGAYLYVGGTSQLKNLSWKILNQSDLYPDYLSRIAGASRTAPHHERHLWMLIMRDSSLIPSRFPGNMAPPPQLRMQLSQVHCPWEITCNLLNTWKWYSSFLSQDCIFKEFTVRFQGLIKITKRSSVYLKILHEVNP